MQEKLSFNNKEYNFNFSNNKQKDIYLNFRNYALNLIEQYDIPEKIKLQQFQNEYEIYNMINNTNFNLEKSQTSLKKYLDWRKKFDSFIVKEEDIKNEINQQKIFWHGEDKDNCKTMVMKVKNIDKGNPLQEKMKFIAYHINKMYDYIENSDQQQVNIIWDREGFNKEKNHDKEFHEEFKTVSGSISNTTHHKIKQILVTHVNLFFQGLFSIAKPFLGQGGKKINLINEYSKLKQWYTEDNLLLDQGGTSKFLPQKIN